MGLFQKKHPELEDLIQTLSMDMENNYKDAAQFDFQRLKNKYVELKAEGSLKKRQADYYEPVLQQLEVSLKGYTHKDQPAKWDPNL